MQARKLVRNVADALVNPASKILRGSVGMLGLPVPIDLYRGYDDQPLNLSYMQRYMCQNRIRVHANLAAISSGFDGRASVGKGKLPAVLVDLRSTENFRTSYEGILGALKCGLRHVQRRGRVVVLSDSPRGDTDLTSSAVHGAILSLHQEVGKHGIGINHVVSSIQEGASTQHQAGSSSEKKGVVFDSLDESDPAWYASAFLASPASAFVTGQQLEVSSDAHHESTGLEDALHGRADNDALGRMLRQALARAEQSIVRTGAIGSHDAVAEHGHGTGTGTGTGTGAILDAAVQQLDIVEQVRTSGLLRGTDGIAGAFSPLSGGIALVTGAARGIGRAVAERLAMEGAAVFCVDVPQNKDALESTVRSAGGFGLLLDVTGDDAAEVLKRAIAQCSPIIRDAQVGAATAALVQGTDEHSRGEVGMSQVSAYAALGMGESVVFEPESFSLSGSSDGGASSSGGLDILVHNAGITRDRSLANMSPEEAAAVFAVNLEAIERIEAGIGALAARSQEGGKNGTLANGGRVVVLSSIVGRAGAIGQCAYAATKNAVASYAAALGSSPDLRHRGITVNAISPGFIETDMTAKIPFGGREIARRMSSFKQGGLPWDVASSIAFLASPYAHAISGQNLRVCGGHMIGR